MFVLSLVCVMFVGCYITPASTSTSFALNEDIAAVFGRIGMSLCKLLFTFSVYMYVISTSYDLHSFVVFIELDMCPVSDPIRCELPWISIAPDRGGTLYLAENLAKILDR
jgi:hypothetical protein